MDETSHDDAKWWQRGIVYQVYPRSFQDSNGDGIGDLRGIESRLDHLVDLGVDAVWISPIHPSPMADFGYDVADYRGVDPIFGTSADLDRLIATAHDLGLRVLLDLVPSHTSDQHPWFLASRSSRDDAKRNWYVWHDAAPDGGPPNNWVGEFGGPAWTFDDTTGQYYLNIYLPQQPALNWHHPDVQAAMFDVIRYWFDRGIDGFRVDAVQHLTPDPLLRDNPPDPDWTPDLGPARRLRRTYTAHRPELHDHVREMRRIADGCPGDRVLIGEAYGTLAEFLAYYGADLDGFHLPFNFQLIGADWTAANIASIVEGYEAALPVGGWPNWVLGNHDKSRIASRVGEAQARVAAMLLLTLRGTPTIYQGDELGMTDVDVPADAVRDPWELRVPGLGLGRDPVRTPIPWDDTPGAGFTTGEPWLPIGRRDGVDVRSQWATPGSVLRLHRDLIALRRSEPALSVGSYGTVSSDADVFVYERRHRDRTLTVALNFSDRSVTLGSAGRALVSTIAGRSDDPPVRNHLDPHEGLVLESPDPG